MQITREKIKIRIGSVQYTKLDSRWNTFNFVKAFRFIHFSRLYFPVSGEGKIELEGRSWSLTRGKITLIPPYAHIVLSCQEMLEKYWCHFNAMLEESETDVFTFLPTVQQIDVPEAEYSHLEYLFRKAIEGMSAEMTSNAGTLYAESALTLLLQPFLQQMPPLADTQEGSRLLKVLCYMNENLNRPLTLTDLARAAGIHPNYLCTLFRSTGRSPMNYLRHLQIYRALEKLRQPGSRVGEIAETTGFRNATNMTRCFRDHFGISPREYRKLHSSADR